MTNPTITDITKMNPMERMDDRIMRMNVIYGKTEDSVVFIIFVAS